MNGCEDNHEPDKGEADEKGEFIRAMLRNFEAADADHDGVVTFSGAKPSHKLLSMSIVEECSIKAVVYEGA